MGVYTIAGGKGGVGKSTTTASLGVALHEAGYDVALVDADLALPNLAEVLGEPNESGIHPSWRVKRPSTTSSALSRTGRTWSAAARPSSTSSRPTRRTCGQ